eukprot:jgi/Botrbrau1/10045/Bobra.0355s0004.1
MGLRGMVASSQPLASEAGMRILQAGGNAADAAVAMAAALNVTEPCSTGIGGDAFALFFDAQTKTVKAAMGSGRSGAAASLQAVRERGISSTSLPAESGLCVTVRGRLRSGRTLSTLGLLVPVSGPYPSDPIGGGRFSCRPRNCRPVGGLFRPAEGAGVPSFTNAGWPGAWPGSVMRNRDLGHHFSKPR